MDLRPNGQGFACPNDPINVICNLTWTHTNTINWTLETPARKLNFLYLNGPQLIPTKIDNVGEILILSVTSSYVVTKLEVPEARGLIPMIVTCGDGAPIGFESEDKYTISYQSKK